MASLIARCPFSPPDLIPSRWFLPSCCFGICQYTEIAYFRRTSHSLFYFLSLLLVPNNSVLLLPPVRICSSIKYTNFTKQKHLPNLLLHITPLPTDYQKNPPNPLPTILPIPLAAISLLIAFLHFRSTRCNTGHVDERVRDFRDPRGRDTRWKRVELHWQRLRLLRETRDGRYWAAKYTTWPMRSRIYLGRKMRELAIESFVTRDVCLSSE